MPTMNMSRSKNIRDQVEAGRDSGFLLIAMAAVTLPLVLIIAAATTLMSSRNTGLMERIRGEKAFLAAESGIDEAIYASNNFALTSGVSISRDLGNGLSFIIDPTDLGGDGVDNDGDATVDEADEDVIEIIVTGSYRGVRRRLVAYLGVASWSVAFESAIAVTDPATNASTLDALFAISGVDKKMDDTAGAGPNLPGMSFTTAAAVAAQAASLSPAQAAQITGLGLTPSLGLATSTIDVNAIVQSVQNTANIVLTSDEYENANWGNGPAGDFNVVYRSGDLELAGTTRGAGILVITEGAEFHDDFRWDGVVIVLGGSFEMHDNSTIYGALIYGGSGSDSFEMHGNAKVQYSSEAIAGATGSLGSGGYSLFNGWQEISSR